MMQPENETPKISIGSLKNSAAPKPPTDVDTVLEKIKPFGRYQILASFIYCFAYFQGIINNLFMGYGGIKPKWSCSDPAAYNHTKILPFSVTDNCQVYYDCPPGNLSFVSEFHSIVSEWSLVCNNDYYVSLITTIQMIGLLTGAVMIGPVSDMFGRKWVFVGLLSIEYIIGCLSALSPSATVFTVFRFVLGWFIGAENVVGWVFVAEVTTNRYRLLVLVVAASGLSLWNQVLIAYLTKDWKWYSIVGNLEGVPVLPILVIFALESPRWLAQKGRLDEARNVLEKIARINRTSHLLPENIDLETETSKKESGEGKKTYQIWDLFRTRRLATYTLVSVAMWFLVCAAYYGMYFNIGNLPTDVYINGVMFAAMEWLVIPLAAYDAYNPRMNRKYMVVILFSLAAVFNVIVALFHTVIPKNDISGGFLTFCSIIGVVCLEAVFDTAYVYSVELFPTLLRSSASGLSSMSARIGGAIAPQLLYAAKAWTPLPYVMFGAFCLFGATIVGLFLPNTKNLHLPETVAQTNRLAADSENGVERLENSGYGNVEDAIRNGIQNGTEKGFVNRIHGTTEDENDMEWSKRNSDKY